jgi:hypothetical protein
MKLETSLDRLLRRYGLLNLLEELARVCLARAQRYGKAGQCARLQPFQLQGYESSCQWHRYARAVRKILGEIRRDEPSDVPVRRKERR